VFVVDMLSVAYGLTVLLLKCLFFSKNNVKMGDWNQSWKNVIDITLKCLYSLCSVVIKKKIYAYALESVAVELVCFMCFEQMRI